MGGRLHGTNHTRYGPMPCPGLSLSGSCSTRAPHPTRRARSAGLGCSTTSAVSVHVANTIAPKHALIVQVWLLINSQPHRGHTRRALPAKHRPRIAHVCHP